MNKIIILIFLLTLSCTNNKVINSHGPSALNIKINDIEISKSNKNDIKKIFGKPSSESLFNEDKWYYIERKKTNQSIIKLGKQKITINHVLEINFDKYGIVQSKKLYTLEDMKEVNMSKDITSTEYQGASYIQKMLNSVRQKIDAPKINRNNR
tara:strand:- start:123 stop:581 length:459 start_codon:yes stop_codon:yes gene_type:complete